MSRSSGRNQLYFTQTRRPLWTQMPALTSHAEKVATALALQTLDLDVHRRKWSLTIQGIKGDAGEEDAVTRKACVDLARNHLGIADANEKGFSACHRLNKRKDAGIIIRFQDLSRRNEWLDGAKNLRTHTERISISPDLPPVLRHLKTELLQKRKDMSPEHKKKSYVKIPSPVAVCGINYCKWPPHSPLRPS